MNLKNQKFQKIYKDIYYKMYFSANLEDKENI